MREILFRGFTPDEKGKDKAFVKGEWIKGQWVQGSYWQLNKTTYCFKEDYERDLDNTERYIVFDQMTDWGLPNRHLQADVIPETVGQYTGLTDRNGKKIFEGDIGKYKQTDGAKINGKPIMCIGKVVYNAKTASFAVDSKDEIGAKNYDYFPIKDFEVIGNIHDNPKLLKGGEG